MRVPLEQGSAALALVRRIRFHAQRHALPREWLTAADEVLGTFGDVRTDHPECAPTPVDKAVKVNQCGETCERAKLCAACSIELAPPAPAAMPTGSALNNAFLAWWETADGWGGSTLAACMAAFKAGASVAAPAPVAQPLTDEQIRGIAEDFASSFMHGGTQFDEFNSTGFAHAIERAHGIKGVA